MSAKEIKALERRAFKEWNKGKAATMAEIDEIFATSVVFHSSIEKDVYGLKEYKQYFSALYDAFPDVHWTLDDLVAEGEKVVVRYTLTGTHKGEYMGVPSTNKKVAFWGIGIDRFAGGKIVEEWARYDTLDFMQQLGAIPEPKK
jgi:hypothetical protein